MPARLHKSPLVIQPKVQKPAVDAGPLADAEFEALQKPEPHVLEGDVIAYRLLHIGDDWTPQVCSAPNGADNLLSLSLDEASPGQLVMLMPTREWQAKYDSMYLLYAPKLE